MMPQYADFMYQIGMLDEKQRDYFQKFALQAVTYIQQKNFKAAFEVRFPIHCILTYYLCTLKFEAKVQSYRNCYETTEKFVQNIHSLFRVLFEQVLSNSP